MSKYTDKLELHRDAHAYYKKSSEELQAQVERLEKLQEIVESVFIDGESDEEIGLMLRVRTERDKAEGADNGRS